MALSSDRMVVYTCVTEGYDEIMPAPAVNGLAFILLTDVRAEHFGGWSVVSLPSAAGKGAMANRYAKMHPHLLFPEYDVSIYIDGNIRVVTDVRPIAKLAIERGDIALYRHPIRNCIYAEAEECAAIGYDWRWNIQRQMRRYLTEGYPAKNGLYEANVMIRRHHSMAVKELMSAWWSEYRGGVKRDQLSLPYLSWKLRVPIVSLGRSDIRSDGEYFSLTNSHVPEAGIVRRIRGRINRQLQWVAGLRRPRDEG